MPTMTPRTTTHIAPDDIAPTQLRRRQTTCRQTRPSRPHLSRELSFFLTPTCNSNSTIVMSTEEDFKPKNIMVTGGAGTAIDPHGRCIHFGNDPMAVGVNLERGTAFCPCST